MKIYDVVLDILQKYPETRDSDHLLLWYVWSKVKFNAIAPDDLITLSFRDWMEMPSSESVTRARRKVQENKPELQATKRIKKLREQKEEMKGMFPYHEELKPRNPIAWGT